MGEGGAGGKPTKRKRWRNKSWPAATLRPASRRFWPVPSPLNSKSTSKRSSVDSLDGSLGGDVVVGGVVVLVVVLAVAAVSVGPLDLWWRGNRSRKRNTRRNRTTNNGSGVPWCGSDPPWPVRSATWSGPDCRGCIRTRTRRATARWRTGSSRRTCLRSDIETGRHNPTKNKTKSKKQNQTHRRGPCRSPPTWPRDLRPWRRPPRRPATASGKTTSSSSMFEYQVGVFWGRFLYVHLQPEWSSCWESVDGR